MLSQPERARLERLVQVANEHRTDAEIREDIGDVIVFCDCTVPDGEGRRLACEINAVRSMSELLVLLGY